MSEARAFDGVIADPLGGRSRKPRGRGQTMVIDKGLGLTETGDLLELAADYIDYIKFAFGTSALYTAPLLRSKIALIRSYGIDAYPGGTFLEIALLQGALERYLDRAQSLGFTCIEVSDGTITMTPEQRREAIRLARQFGFKVITEVGKKDGAVELEPDEALRQIRADLAEGACKVIVEGRESGKGVGIYDAQGRLKSDEMDRIVSGAPDVSALMWEAPLKSQQQELIIRFGPDVNLGNIAPGEVLALEALRCGFRGDTLKATLDASVTSVTTGGDRG